MTVQATLPGMVATPPARCSRWRGPVFYRHLPTLYDRRTTACWYPHEVDVARRLAAHEHELGDRAAARLR